MSNVFANFEVEQEPDESKRNVFKNFSAVQPQVEDTWDYVLNQGGSVRDLMPHPVRHQWDNLMSTVKEPKEFEDKLTSVMYMAELSRRIPTDIWDIDKQMSRYIFGDKELSPGEVVSRAMQNEKTITRLANAWNGLISSQQTEEPPSWFEDMTNQSAKGIAVVSSGAAKTMGTLMKSGPPFVSGVMPYETEADRKEREALGDRLKEDARFLWQIAKHPDLALKRDDLLNKVIGMGFETVSYITGTTLSTIMAGPLGGFAVGWMVEGNSAYQTAIDEGISEDKARIIGMGVGVVSGAIESFGGRFADKLFEKATAKIKNRVLRTGANLTVGSITEALEEAGQEMAAITGESTYRDVSWDEAVRRTLASAGGGLAVGGMFKTAGAAVRGVTAESPYNQQVRALRVALAQGELTQEVIDGLEETLKEQQAETKEAPKAEPEKAVEQAQDVTGEKAVEKTSELTEEAKKYKTAEEFIEAQETVFHSGSFVEEEGYVFIVEGEDGGIHFGTEDAARARISGKAVDDAILGIEVYQNDDGTWAFEIDNADYGGEYATKDEAEIAAEELATSTEVDEYMADEKFMTEAKLLIKNPKKVADQGQDWSDAIKQAKAEGYDSIVYVNQYEDKGSLSYIVFSEDQIVTKTQMAEIWEKAQKQAPAPTPKAEQPPMTQAGGIATEKAVEQAQEVAGERTEEEYVKTQESLYKQGEELEPGEAKTLPDQRVIVKASDSLNYGNVYISHDPIPINKLEPMENLGDREDKAAEYLRDEGTKNIPPIYVSPPLIDDKTGEVFYEIHNGHHRYLQAQEAGLKELPVMMQIPHPKYAQEYASAAKQAQAKAPAPTPKAEQPPMTQAGGIASERVTPNLYIGNVTPGMKQRIAESGEFNPEDIQGFKEGGFPTKRTKIEMTRSEAGNYLTWAIGAIDSMVSQVESGKALDMTHQQVAMTQALIGDIKAIQEALGYEIKPAQMTFRMAKKLRKKLAGEVVMRMPPGLAAQISDALDLSSKQALDQFVHPTEKVTKTTYEIFKQVMENVSKESQHAYMAGARDTVKQHKNLAKIAALKLKGLKISEGQHKQLMNAVSRARTEAEQITAMAAVERVYDKARRKDAVTKLKTAIKKIPKYGKHTALRPEALERIDEAIGDIDIQKLSEPKREELEQTKKALIEVGFDVGKGLKELSQDELGGVEELVGQKMLKQLERLEKTPLTEFTSDDIYDLTDTVEYVLKQDTAETKARKEAEAKRNQEIIDASIAEATTTKTAAKETTEEGKKPLSLWRRVLNIVSVDSLHRWALAEKMTSVDGKVTKKVLDEDLHEGKVKGLGKKREAFEILWKELKRLDWNASDYKRIKETHSVTLGGKRYKLTTAEIMSLGMNLRSQRNAKQIARTKGLWIANRDVATPTMGEIVRALENLTDKERAVMDVVYDINDKVLAPAVNEVFEQLMGFPIARDPFYWGLKRMLERLVRGKVIEGAAIEDTGMFQPFFGSKEKLQILPFWDQLLTTIQNSASLYGMALPMKRARTLLNNAKWREAMDAAGRKNERLALTEIFRRSQGVASDRDNLGFVAGTIMRRAGKAILGWRVTSMGVQSASIPMAMTIIPDKYAVPVSGVTTQKGKEQSERIDKYSPFLWFRHRGGRVDIVTGDYGSETGVEKLIFNKHADVSLEGLRKVDRLAIEAIDTMTQRWVADTTDYKFGSDNFWKEVARRSEDVVRKTQPMWDIDERSVLASSANPWQKPWFMFRAAREAVLNQNLMAVDRVVKAGGDNQSLADATNTLAATTLSTMMVIGIRASIVAATAFLARQLTGSEPPEEDKNKALALTGKLAQEMTGYIPGGSVIVGVAKEAAGLPIWNEFDPDQLLVRSPITFASGLADFRRAIKHYIEGDKEQMAVDLLAATNDLIESLSLIKAIPSPGVMQMTTRPLERELKHTNRRSTTLVYEE